MRHAVLAYFREFGPNEERVGALSPVGAAGKAVPNGNGRTMLLETEEQGNRPLAAVKVWVRGQFKHEVASSKDRFMSRIFAEVMDLGILRHLWTNEGEIAPGVWRTNHPGRRRIKGYARRGFHTVLNLRNDTDKAPCRLAQNDFEDNGMAYFSYPMAPRHAPKAEVLLGLIALFPKLEKPVLIHCKSGADRTGLAAALWLLTQEGASMAEARRQLSLEYLHFREFETGVLDAVLDLYEEEGRGRSFEEWVRTGYDPLAANFRAQSISSGLGQMEKLDILRAGLWKYAQFREAVWHKSFEGPYTTDRQRRRARFFMNWVDHGILRTFWHNQAEISPGVIRANHPSEKRLRRMATEGLKTVINLRGASMQPQYLLEKELCDELGLDLVDIPMTATAAPTAASILKLFATLDRCEKPALIHCKSGADRTSIAAALWLLDQGATMAEARAQMSIRFIHLKSSAKGVLDAVLDDFEAANIGGAVSVRDWLKSGYNPEAITERFRRQRAKS